MNKALIITLAAFVLTVDCIAQQQLKIAGAIYALPTFRTDSTQSFDDTYVTLNILPSIKSSGYDIEIRAILPGSVQVFGNLGGCIVIKGNKDSLSADYYILRMRTLSNSPTDILIKKDPKNSDYDLMLTKQNVAPAYLAAAVRGLLRNGVTNLLSNNDLIASLQKRGIKIQAFGPMDCCGDMLYEVKIGNRFRNFTTNAFYYDANPNIKQITYSQRLDAIVYKLAGNQ